MKINNNHLCYSLNVFPREDDLTTRLANIADKFKKIRSKLNLSSEKPFALGFWSDSIFLEQMKNQKNLALIKKMLNENNFYVFTVNAFPYGSFHGESIKEKVYLPDWTNSKRLVFSCNAADFLAELMPEGISGSISTLPGAYKKVVRGSNLQAKEQQIAINLLKMADYLFEIEEKTGKHIELAIEMEPDCLWESPQEFVDFFKTYLAKFKNATSYIGVCYDTSHQELLPGMPGEGLVFLIENGIKISKIQLSAALRVEGSKGNIYKNLIPFADKVYLHQTRMFNQNGDLIKKFADIPENKEEYLNNVIVKSHFHTPIFCEEISSFVRASKDELMAVLKKLEKKSNICGNLEIETYTYNVLPKKLSQFNIEDSIAKEYKWIFDLWDII